MIKQSLYYLLFLVLAFHSSNAATIAYVRFEDGGAEGEVISPDTSDPDRRVKSEVNSEILQTTANGDAKFDTRVPFPFIQEGDDTTTSKKNEFSSYSTSSADRFIIPNNEILDTESFTVEFFVMFPDAKPEGYMNFVNRVVNTSNRWLIGHSHNNDANYGRVVLQFSMPNNTFRQSASTDRPFVDVEGNDGDTSKVTGQLSGGDGSNDSPEWRHIAFTYSGDSNPGSIEMFYNGVSSGSRTLIATTFAHPAADLLFGMASSSGELLFDEFRYSDEVLTPDQFLRKGVAIPEPKHAVLLLSSAMVFACLVWRRLRS